MGSNTPIGHVAYLQERLGQANLLRKAKSYSSHHGEAKHLVHMATTPISKWTGVLNGVAIPFEDLLQM